MEVAAHLLQAGANPNFSGSDDESRPPIHTAIFYNRNEIIYLLLTHGASLKTAFKGRTAQEYWLIFNAMKQAFLGNPENPNHHHAKNGGTTWSKCDSNDSVVCVDVYRRCTDRLASQSAAELRAALQIG